MANWAIINRETEYIENIIFVADGDIWPSSNTHLAVEFPAEGISGSWSMLSVGWKYMHGQFVEPPASTAPIDTVSNVIGTAPDVIA
jgi:hypothetical protein